MPCCSGRAILEQTIENENTLPNHTLPSYSSSSDKSFSEKISNWIVRNKISRNAANELLQILRDDGHILPADSRTLLKTPRFCTVVDMYPGQYAHLGLQNGLEHILGTYKNLEFKDDNIEIILNIDGLPLSKSSSTQFWPILVAIEGYGRDPFIAGIFCGSSKPADVNNYLEQFLAEYKSLKETGLLYKSKKYEIKIKSIICDAPAKAFVLGVKGHNGYFGCNKCTQQGEFVDGSVTFPEINATLRTDESFRNRSDEDHHKTVSPFQTVDIGLVSQVPLDYMHLICLGITKRLIGFWVKGNKEVRMETEHVKSVSKLIIDLREYIPQEFCRKPRPLEEVDRWKASEFRQFLFYTGPIALKNFLSKIMFDHFMCLHVVVRILASPKFSMSHISYAQQLAEYFVEKYKIIYGAKYVTYNVHNLIHIVNDVKKFGPLDNFSAFNFENYLYEIKKLVKNSRYPLQQIVNRISEQREHITSPRIQNYPILGDINFSNCPDLTLNGPNNVYFKSVSFKHMSLKLCKSDHCFITNTGLIFILLNICKKNNSELILIANKLLPYKEFFETPCKSSKFNIHITKLQSNKLYFLSPNDVQAKCIKYPAGNDKYLIIPLLHNDHNE